MYTAEFHFVNLGHVPLELVYEALNRVIEQILADLRYSFTPCDFAQLHFHVDCLGNTLHSKGINVHNMSVGMLLEWFSNLLQIHSAILYNILVTRDCC